MNSYGKIFCLALAGALALSACAGTAATQDQTMAEKPASTEVMMAESTQAPIEAEPTHDAMMAEPTQMPMEAEPTHDAMMAEPTQAMMAEPTEGAMMETPAWFSVPLTDVRTGETLTIADMQGKVILLEDMAVWCTTCLSQQKQVVELHKLLGDQPDLVSLGLDIDPNEDAAKLKAYVDEKGFNWNYAVSPVEVSREIGQLYGAQFLNPPSAPMMIIDRHGNVHPLPFGVKSAAQLQQALQPFLNEGM